MLHVLGGHGDGAVVIAVGEGQSTVLMHTRHVPRVAVLHEVFALVQRQRPGVMTGHHTVPAIDPRVGVGGDVGGGVQLPAVQRPGLG